MLASVNLDHESFLETDKVENVVLERLLSAKLGCGEPTIPQQAPHCPFGVSRLVPHLPCKLAERRGGRSMGRVSWHQPLTQVSLRQTPVQPSPTRGEGAVTCIALGSKGSVRWRGNTSLTPASASARTARSCRPCPAPASASRGRRASAWRRRLRSGRRCRGGSAS